MCDVAISAARKYKECCEIAERKRISNQRLDSKMRETLSFLSHRKASKGSWSTVAYTERKNDVRWERWTNAVVQVIEIHRSTRSLVLRRTDAILLRFKQGRPTECIPAL